MMIDLSYRNSVLISEGSHYDFIYCGILTLRYGTVPSAFSYDKNK